jgi:hypothetical protein
VKVKPIFLCLCVCTVGVYTKKKRMIRLDTCFCMGGMTLQHGDSYIVLSLVNANDRTMWHLSPVRNENLSKDTRRGININKSTYFFFCTICDNSQSIVLNKPVLQSHYLRSELSR